VLHGDPGFVAAVQQVLDRALARPWPDSGVRDMVAMRLRLEESRSERDLKRGPGGLADIEFITAVLQCQNASSLSGPLEPNTLDALTRLEEAGILSLLQAAQLREAHAFLNHCLMRLRIVHNRVLDELPPDPTELEKLRRRLGPGAPGDLASHIANLRARTRALFYQLLEGNIQGAWPFNQ